MKTKQVEVEAEQTKTKQVEVEQMKMNRRSFEVLSEFVMVRH